MFRLVVFLCILSLLGMSILYYATPWGPSVGSDSVYYITSAENLYKGIGFGLPWGNTALRPYAGNPPLYPFAVLGFLFLGFDVVSAARWVNILLFGALVFSLGWFVFHQTRSVLLALGVSILAIVLPHMFDVFSSAMSEPLFYVLFFVASFLFLQYLEKHDLKLLVGVAVFLGLAFLTRYTALAAMAATGVLLLFAGPKPWKKKITHAVLLAVLAALPGIAWLLYSYNMTSEVAEREFVAVTNLWRASASFRLAMVDIWWNWIPFSDLLSIDYNIQKYVFAVFGLALVASLAWIGRDYILNRPDLSAEKQRAVLWITYFQLFSLFYIIIYGAAILFAHPTPDLIPRIFFPLFWGILFIFLGICFYMHQLQKGWLWVGIGFLVLIMVANLPITLQHASQMHENGGGYTSRFWRESPVLLALKDIPYGTPIITNEPAAVLFLTGRPAHWLPDLSKSGVVDELVMFGDADTGVEEQTFRQQKGALVLFPTVYWQLHLFYEDKTDMRLETMLEGLEIYADFSGYSGIYFYPNLEQ
jgi:4-amino-4-deoxy-L-arabinose transferase-like glycosyltransferase